MPSIAMETLNKMIGIDPDLLAIYQDHETKQDQVLQQQYRPEKQEAELAALTRTTVLRLVALIAKGRIAADKERDTALRKIDDENAQRMYIPGRSSTETGEEHTHALLRTLIKAHQGARERELLLVDIQTIHGSIDPAMIAATLDETIASGSPETVIRIGRAAEARLQMLAVPQPGRTLTQNERDALLVATMDVQKKMKQFRETLPAARREKVLRDHGGRVAMASQQIQQTLDLFRGLRSVFDSELRKVVVEEAIAKR